MGFVLLAVLCLLFLGGLPRWRYRGTLTYVLSGIMGLLFVIVLVLLLEGYIPSGL